MSAASVQARPTTIASPPDLYTPIHLLKATLQDRCADQDLVQEVVQFSRVPAPLLHRLEARPIVLWRPIATPNYELIRFLKLCQAWDLRSLILELPEDRFFPGNPYKRSLCRPSVRIGHDASGASRMRSYVVAPIARNAGRPFSTIICRNGVPLIDFHRELLEAIAGPDVVADTHNGTAFYAGEKPRAYYERFFALMTCLGALAESYSITTDSDRRFTEQVVVPAFEAVRDRFGVRPLIMRLLPDDTEGDPFWDAYPKATADLLKRLLFEAPHGPRASGSLVNASTLQERRGWSADVLDPNPREA